MDLHGNRGSSTTPTMDLQSSLQSLSESQVILQILEMEDYHADNIAPPSSSSFNRQLAQVTEHALVQNLNEFDQEEVGLGSGASTTPTITLAQNGNKRRLVDAGILSCPTLSSGDLDLSAASIAMSEEPEDNSLYSATKPDPPIKYKEWSVDSVIWADAYTWVNKGGLRELVLGAGCLLEGLFTKEEIIGSTLRGKKGKKQLCPERQTAIFQMLGWMRGTGTGKGLRYPYNFTPEDPIHCPLTEDEQKEIRKKVFIEKRSQLSIKFKKVKPEMEEAPATPSTPAAPDFEEIEETAEEDCPTSSIETINVGRQSNGNDDAGVGNDNETLFWSLIDSTSFF